VARTRTWPSTHRRDQDELSKNSQQAYPGFAGFAAGMSNLEDIPPVPKIEPFEEESFSESSPEPEEQSLTQEPAQVQKRKGGRKPVCRAHIPAM